MHAPTPLTPAAPLIRPATPADVDLLHRFIVELAEAERFPGAVTAEPEDLARSLFGTEPPLAEAVVAMVNGEPAGFALFYPTYSTILGRPGLHLEDLYICPEHRGGGLGRALLGHLADLAVRRGCARLEWWVLRDNEPALRFYDRLHARGLHEIEVRRLDGDVLRHLAATYSRG
ncbi:ribosomal protein S18 acetylase RimI-like enzyme [Micromonospora pisi]|uniref:Ribosomal protein S18 acetylase RimI-like enzyme n=1 Tax=Micromonospora pisi TaxID=589240 RepID=A0A495JS00_9ACTN|nr:GNAT family N-acetyltransferase [Micromonospora pisi]RKR91288.1 ribosomal protein S18 acetylase RimI-like enzyme [Micromonospora pisi]